MRGAKMLTWSSGLREFVGLDAERTDQEVVDAEEPQPAETVAIITSGGWDVVRNKRGAACAILDAAELAPNATEAHKAIQALIRRAVRSRVPP